MGCYVIQGFHINDRTFTALFFTHDLEHAVKFFDDYIFDDKDDIVLIGLCSACCEPDYAYDCPDSDCLRGYFPHCDVTEWYNTRCKN